MLQCLDIWNALPRQVTDFLVNQQDAAEFTKQILQHLTENTEHVKQMQDIQSLVTILYNS